MHNNNNYAGNSNNKEDAADNAGHYRSSHTLEKSIEIV